MGRPPVNIEPGTRYGMLVVIERSGSTIRGRASLWRAACDCGADVLVLGSRFANGGVKSCGCLKKRPSWNRRHGMSKSPTYTTWRSMKERCEKPRHSSFEHYGARGVRICDRWQSFDNFLADMGERPRGTSIDRINTYGDYEPSNCRWATPRQQARNTRATKLTEAAVREIRGRVEHGERQASVARRFGLRSCTVSEIIRGELWAEERSLL